MAFWFNPYGTATSAKRVKVRKTFTPASFARKPQYVFGHQASVQPHLEKATANRAVIRFLGPSGYPKDDKTAYRQRVSGILDTLAEGLRPHIDQIEINTGVSAVGLDLMLSEKLFNKFHVSGVVSWMLPKVTLRYQGGKEELLTIGSQWELHQQKEETVKWAFDSAALLIHGLIPEKGITIPINEMFGLGNRVMPDTLDDDGRIVEEMLIEQEEALGMAPVDHMTIYGPTWGEAYDINRATLQAVVVLGGGLISREEAIAARQNRIPVFCIDPEILPEPHNMGKSNEMDSASTYLVRTHGFPKFTAEEIAKGIVKDVLKVRRVRGRINIPYRLT